MFTFYTVYTNQSFSFSGLKVKMCKSVANKLSFNCPTYSILKYCWLQEKDYSTIFDKMEETYSYVQHSG